MKLATIRWAALPVLMLLAFPATAAPTATTADGYSGIDALAANESGFTFAEANTSKLTGILHSADVLRASWLAVGGSDKGKSNKKDRYDGNRGNDDRDKGKAGGDKGKKKDSYGKKDGHTGNGKNDHDWGGKHRDAWGDKDHDKKGGKDWNDKDYGKDRDKGWGDKDRDKGWGDKDRDKDDEWSWWKKNKKKDDGKDHHDHHGDGKSCDHDHHGGGGNDSCPAGTKLISKYEWNGKYTFEKPYGNSKIVKVTGDEEGGNWTSITPIAALVLKGSTDTETLFYAGTKAGEFTNENLKTKSGRTADISNIQFCNCIPGQTAAPTVSISESGGVVTVVVTDDTGIGSLSINAENLTADPANDFEPGDDSVTLKFTVTNSADLASIEVEATDICGNTVSKDFSKPGNVCLRDSGAPTVSVAFVAPNKFVITITDDTGIESIDLDVTNATSDPGNSFTPGSTTATLTYTIDNLAQDAYVEATATDKCGKSATDAETKDGDVCYSDGAAPTVSVEFVAPNKFVITISDDTGIESIDVDVVNASADPGNTFTPGSTSATLTYLIDDPSEGASIEVTATDLCGKEGSDSSSQDGNICLRDAGSPVVTYSFIDPTTVQVKITDDTGIMTLAIADTEPGRPVPNLRLVSTTGFTPGVLEVTNTYEIIDLTQVGVLYVTATDACGGSCPDAVRPGVRLRTANGGFTQNGTVTDDMGISFLHLFNLQNAVQTQVNFTPGQTTATFSLDTVNQSQGPGSFGFIVADQCNALIVDPTTDQNLTFDAPGAEEADLEAAVVSQQHAKAAAPAGQSLMAGGAFGAPATYALHGSYPNPFRSTATLSYDLPKATTVKLTVYDILGRAVAVLVDGEVSAGAHEVLFDASHLPSGTYLYRLQTPEKSFTKQMVLMK